MSQNTFKNYVGKVIAEGFEHHNKLAIGEEIYVNIMEDGKVLIYRPYDRKAKKGIVDSIMKLDEAKKYFTCVRKTDFDVYGNWSKMMSDRYW